ncbi:MAG: putative N6-adenine-specific DNA methylase [Azoarcus sp.]|uniref:Putative N6-adenine-specific DNA methylase n=1 Tax=Aromatoleum tolulyticum TaxID=34027 RepID=A0A1N6Z830_9RHOO|nr:THUMP domain-containing protein [Aromatoleum tolulyticum]MCK9987004.1 putative N6-adenine-specific DNA methylase [Azoarcus sp.]SIR22955.1 putative N6-adenine-specific DNA methylase [Aromatoleum tolulyticum]
MSESFFSPCPRGLEPMLAEELTALGARDVEATHGGVGFSGDWQTCYRANLESRIATRVMWRLAQGRYQSEEDIYRLAYGATWAKWFTVDDTIRIYVTAKQSPLRSLEFVTLKIKDAVCDHFRTVTGKRPSVDTANPAVRIHAFLTRDRVTLYLDTSGEPLYKRGYKPAAVEAPLKENLAAGILRISGWQPGEALIDPMCGSGTFLIEAAQIALDIAPGLGRSFAFERFRHFDGAAWAAIRKAAEVRRKSPRPLRIYGSDVVGEQVRRSRVNLQAAGLADCVTLDRADFLAREAPAAEGVMVTNPPYGVRIGEAEELAALYPQFGDALKKHWSGWRCYFLSADPALPKLIGLKASKRTPLFNGALECRVFEYKMIAGSNRRKPAEEA